MNQCPNCRGPMIPLFMPGSLACKQECDLVKTEAAPKDAHFLGEEVCRHLHAKERVRAWMCPHGHTRMENCVTRCFVGTEFWMEGANLWMQSDGAAPYRFEDMTPEEMFNSDWRWFTFKTV